MKNLLTLKKQLNSKIGDIKRKRKEVKFLAGEISVLLSKLREESYSNEEKKEFLEILNSMLKEARELSIEDYVLKETIVESILDLLNEKRE